MPAQQTMTLAQWIAQSGVTMTSMRTKTNPHLDDASRMDRHFLCTLHKGGDTMEVYFSQGSAFTEDPTLVDVLDCLASDASGVENVTSFEEWAGDYGYDTDSRKAERTYDTIKAQAEELKRLIGDKEYADLLWNVERE